MDCSHRAGSARAARGGAAEGGGEPAVTHLTAGRYRGRAPAEPHKANPQTLDHKTNAHKNILRYILTRQILRHAHKTIVLPRQVYYSSVGCIDVVTPY